MSYSGKFVPKNTQKYEGDYMKITYRSLWERGMMKWCDENPDVKFWSSEEVIIPYYSPVDKKHHRYFMDFKIEFSAGNILLVEVKPEYQTKMPVKTSKSKPSKYLKEVQTFAVNDAKWNAAEKYAASRGWKFSIFTEHALTSLGINVLSTSVSKAQKKRPVKRSLNS